MSQCRRRKYQIVATNPTAIPATTTQNAAISPSPGTSTFIPKMLATSVSGIRTTLKAVSTRIVSFSRCDRMFSFVVSSPATVSR